MLTPRDFVDAYARNAGIVKRQCEGLTHQDSLLQPPCRGNCLNWIVGHVVEGRDALLQVLGEKPIISEAQAKRYGYGSEPVACEGADVMRLERMLALLEQSQKTIEARLAGITGDELAKPGRFAGRDMTLAQRLLFQYFHDTYHTGQAELLRQLAGRNDKVI